MFFSRVMAVEGLNCKVEASNAKLTRCVVVYLGGKATPVPLKDSVSKNSHLCGYERTRVSRERADEGLEIARTCIARKAFPEELLPFIERS